MHANTSLASVGGHTFRLRHLIVIGILAASVAIAFMIRAQPAQYGFELNEFDPFFNYRATLYMVENGIPAYYEWHDTMSWYPEGRDVSRTSQVVLHLAAATTYQAFAAGQMTLYDYTIIFPTVFGALTAIVLFGLVRVIGGTSAGLFAAMLYSVSLPILVRSPIGWFKSEPFGLFLSILAAYLFVSGLYSANRRWEAAARLAAAGLFMSASVSAWGGNQFFVIPIAVLFLALPFLRKDHNFLLWAVPLFAVSTLATSYLFERGIASTPMAGLALVAAAGFLIACIFIQKKSSRHKTRNGLVFLAAVLVILPAGAMAGAAAGIVPNPEYRYLNALNPFLTTEIPLVESVSEHATTTLSQSFLFHSILMIFAGIGAWMVIKSISDNRQNKTGIRTDMLAFALMIGMTGVYISSSYVRLEVFAAVAVIIMASLGLAMLSRGFFARSEGLGMHDGVDIGTGQPAAQNAAGNSKGTESAQPKGEDGMQRRAAGPRRVRKQSLSMLSLPYMAGIVALLLMPLAYSGTGATDVFTITDVPPTILTGGASFGTPTGDWLDALAWIKNSTPPDAVIAAWWDYGYWISTVGERTSLADNATLDDKRIERLADMFMSTPEEAWRELQDMQADYVLVFVAGQMLVSDSPTPLYTLQHGGDESKKQWFMRIGGHDTNIHLHMDGISGTEYFWENTAVAHFFPFSPATYINPANPSQQFPTYVPGALPIYVKDVKYPTDGDGPFRLAYSSPSFHAESTGPMIGIFIYEVNGDYDPAAEEDAPSIAQDIPMPMPIPDNDSSEGMQSEDDSSEGMQSENDTS